jgi:hypothetical protein
MTPDTPSTEALTPDEETRVRRNVAAIVKAEWGDDPDSAYHPEELCQSDRDLIRLLASLDAERAVRQEAADPSGLQADVERLRAMYRQAAEWITDVQMHYVLGPEATPQDVFMVAKESQEAADTSGLREALAFIADWAHDCDDDSGFYGFSQIENMARAALEGATERPLPEVADTIGHGPCDYNGGPGSDQCPHGVFAPQGDDDA